MAFNINEFSSSISENNGLLYSSHFVVMVTAPKWAQGDSDIIKAIPMLCDATELPGVNFETDNIRPSGFGLFDRRPVFSNFAPLTLSFYCDGNGKLLQFFQKWMQNIQNFNVNQRQANTVNGAALGVFNYPDWYETTITISQYDATGKEVCKWTLDRCYPLTLNNIGVAWDQADQLLKLMVQINYRAWTTEAITSGKSAGTDSATYSLGRIDPSASQGINQMFQTNSGFGSLINGTLAQNYYAPLTTDIPVPVITTPNPYEYIVTEPPAESLLPAWADTDVYVRSLITF